ncbi:MAG: type II toxin-antitoxin system HicB family antitoxin [Desulfurellales bacterium]|nr:MAG: type II toxin-antitoxin system HicB family antitoxin [Desulfurellales bacterium]
MDYVAKVSREGSQWLVEFPDCPGCATYGNSKAEAQAMAKEALDLWLESELAHGAVPPRPAYDSAKGWRITVEITLAMAIQLRWLREDRNLTQGQLAKMAGVSQQQIAKLERPGGNPTVKTLDAVGKALGMRFTGMFQAA